MTRGALVRVLPIWTLLLLCLVTAVAQLPTADELYRGAERSYGEKSYRTAGELYARLAETFPGDPRAAEAEFKTGLCQFYLRNYREAVSLLEPYVEAHRDSFWAAKARRILVMSYRQARRRDAERDERLLQEAIDWLEAHRDTRDNLYELVLGLFEFDEHLARNWPEDQEKWDEHRARRKATISRIIELNYDDGNTAKATVRLGQIHAQSRDWDTALALWRETVEKWPKTEHATQAQYGIADRFEDEKEYVRALEAYRAVVRRWPNSEQARSAERRISRIADPQVSLHVNTTQLPGKPVPYSVSTRNVKRVQLAAYRTDPVTEFLKEGKVVERGQGILDSYPSREPVAEWSVGIQDWEGHKPCTTPAEMPLLPTGAYLIRARDPGSAAESERSINLTSLVLIQTVNPEGQLATYVTRRPDGLKAEGVTLSYRRLRRDNVGDRVVVHFGKTTTDEEGLSRISIPQEANRDYLETLAQLGDEIAVLAYGRYRVSQDRPGLVGYVYTDRPVYRPAQTVHYSAVLRRAAEGKLNNLPNQSCHVLIKDPHGEQVLETDLVTNEFGTVHGELELDEEPTLGVYRVNVKLADQWCRGSFRVEEYKKPEFEVTIEPASDDYKPGEEATATIHAEYYFGGPVPGAQVQYTVNGERYWPSYHFPHPYRRFFLDWGAFSYAYWRSVGRSPGDFGQSHTGMVARGTSTTDAEGNATVEFDTWEIEDQDQRYTIKAEVTDQSRRTIEGSTTIKVTQSSYYFHLKTVQRLYHASDKVTVDVKALTANDQPVQTDGELMVYKLIPSEREVEENGETRVEEYDERQPILDDPMAFTTDADGNAHVTFVPDREGHFEVEVTGDDPKRDKPTTSTYRFWAVNDDFDGQNLDYTNLTLESERDIYEVGETARILINSPAKDADALLLIAGRKQLTTRVVHLNGSARLLELPIEESFVPSATIQVSVLDEDHLYEQKRVLFVPPSDKLLQIEVAADKPEYRPGETGHFEVTALDREGGPAEAEVCLAVTDESVYYIQEDLAGPIDKAFYAREQGGQVYTRTSWERERVVERAYQVRYAGVAFRTPYEPWYAETGRADFFAAVEGVALLSDFERVDSLDAAVGPSEELVSLVQPALRKEFADTCFWGPTLRTGADGKASAEVTFPDNLTTWRTTARAITTDTKLGQEKAEVKTTKDVIARLQTPRFLVQRDKATISTIAHNYLDQAKDVRVEFEAEGLQMDGDGQQTVRIEKDSEARIDRLVRAIDPGTALLTTKALTDVESDAMQLPVPILPHGVEKFVWRAGQIADEGAETFELPEERIADSDSLVVQITPSVAASLLDALPYLADYPYGCVEQTMNRFLPSVIVAETATKLKLDTGDKLERVPRMVKAGLRKLYSQQNPDGSWGWWAGGRANLYMTAYVTSGLLRAKAAGYDVRAGVLKEALKSIQAQVKNEKRLDTLAFAAYVLAQSGATPKEAVNRAYQEREKLNEHSRALLALTLHYLRDARKHIVLRNMLDYRIETEHGCHWGRDRCGWRWSDDQVEATAASLLVLVRISPDSPLIPGTVWWLVTNRQGDRWKSTKDTALAIGALSEYLLASSELQAAYTASVHVNDELVKAIEVTPDNALALDGKVVVPASRLRTGRNIVRVHKEGEGALYYSLLATYYTTEEPIKGASSVISVDRGYFTVEEYVDEESKLQVKRKPVEAPVDSGTQLEVELTFTSENEFDYVMFEDYKPAGCEPVDLHSGHVWGEGLRAYREFRDEKVAFFIDHLPQGTHKLTYRVRAETPGDFHVLPNIGKGMYMTDLRCLSDEMRLVIGS